jgi:hypothetical protein
MNFLFQINLQKLSILKVCAGGYAIGLVCTKESSLEPVSEELEQQGKKVIRLY